jgi:hypothetical protein
LLLLQQISSKTARVGCGLRRPLKIVGSVSPVPAAPLIRLFYQVEITHHQIPSSKIRNPLSAADAADGTTRLWQLQRLPRASRSLSVG